MFLDVIALAVKVIIIWFLLQQQQQQKSFAKMRKQLAVNVIII